MSPDMWAGRIQWLHAGLKGNTAHSIRRYDFDRITAHCGFTFLPDRRPEPLTKHSDPCDACWKARNPGGTS